MKGRIKYMANIFKIVENSPVENKVVKFGKNRVTIKSGLNLNDYASCINNIVELCFDEQGLYRPEYKEVARRWSYLKYFTDIELGDVTIENLFSLSQAEWWETIMDYIATTQVYSHIEIAVEEELQKRIKTPFENLCDAIANISNANVDDTISGLTTLFDKINQVDEKRFVKAVTENVIEKTRNSDA